MLPEVPESARPEVDRKLAALDTQIAEAYKRFADSGQQIERDPQFAQNTALGPLKDERVASIGRIGDALARDAAVSLTFEGSPAGDVVAMPRFLRIITGDAKAPTNGDANANASWTSRGPVAVPCASSRSAPHPAARTNTAAVRASRRPVRMPPSCPSGLAGGAERPGSRNRRGQPRTATR